MCLNYYNRFRITYYFYLDASYNEVTTTNKEDQVKLHCIVNVEIHHKNLDITWFKSNDPVLHEVDCNM